MTTPLRETLAMALHAHSQECPWNSRGDWDGLMAWSKLTYLGYADSVLGVLSDWAWDQEDAGDALRYLMGKT